VWLLLVFAAQLLVLRGSRAEEVLVFSTADTTLSQNYPNNNLGGLGFANSGTTQNFTTNRALYRFELSGVVPAGSVVTAAELVLEVTRVPVDGYNSSVFGLHRVLRDWGEGDNVTPPASTSPGAGAPADVGEATWTHRFAGSTGTWGVPGGQAGVDFVAQPSALTPVYSLVNSPYLFGPTPGVVQDVQSWVNDPASNFGWMLISQSEELDFTARRFGSREDPFNPPYLNVSFIRVPEPAAGVLLVLGLSALWGVRPRHGL
jgi:hypothetical protein